MKTGTSFWGEVGTCTLKAYESPTSEPYPEKITGKGVNIMCKDTY